MRLVSLQVLRWTVSVTLLLLGSGLTLTAEPLPLKRAVELALSRGASGADADQQRALASYLEARNQYVPQFVAGSGLGKSWGFPLSLEGSAPSIVNLNTQSALYNPALRDFVRAAHSDWKASTFQSKDQREQIIQDTVLTYAELNHWEALLSHLDQEQKEVARMQQTVDQRVAEGVDSPAMKTQTQLMAARFRMHAAESRGAIDVLRNRLAELTGLPAATIETAGDSIPALPEVKQEDDLAGKAAQNSPLARQADIHAVAQSFRARGEHRSLWPTVDFAGQYALLAQYNNYSDFYKSFQRNNATLGVSIRFSVFNLSQRSRAQAADADAVRAKQDAVVTKRKISEEALRLQRAVQQLAAAQEVADLEYQVAQANVEALQVRIDAGTANLHDLDDARSQSNERFHALQSADFELEKARVGLLRATGGLDDWLGLPK